MLRNFYFIGILVFIVGCANAPKKSEVKKHNGFKVVFLKKNSIYEKMGLKKGDVVTHFNGQKTSSTEEMLELYQAIKKSDKVKISLLRNGEAKTIIWPTPKS